MFDDYFDPVETVELSPSVADEVRRTTCSLCPGRCGIRVHLKDGQIRHIEGDRDHPVNRGALCAKGAAGIMEQYSPARLTGPLKRVGERGKAEFEEIAWDEALDIATRWLGDVRKSDPRRLAILTGRDPARAFTGWWADRFGTPNHTDGGGLGAANMAAAGLHTIGGGFGAPGEPDWARARYLLMFGVAEDGDSIPIKRGIATLKRTGARFVAVNPVRTGYSAVADEWIGIRPGTDGMFVLALVHELLKADRIDLDYIVRYTNLPWLVIDDPGGHRDGLFARAPDGAPLCLDKRSGTLENALLPGVAPGLTGTHILADGRRATPAFALMARRYLDDAYAPEAVETRTGIDAATIRRVAAELAEAAFAQEIVLDQPWTDWAGRRHETMTGRPVAIHAMRGISAHSNGFQTCRAIHLLQVLLGAIDCPGGFRYRPPFPRPASPAGPETLRLEEDGTPVRLDRALSWDAPLGPDGMMQSVIANAHDGDPHTVEVLLLHRTNPAWNAAMGTAEAMEMLGAQDPETGEYRIRRIICSDSAFSETVAYADLVLPDTTSLERWDCFPMLGDADGPSDAVAPPVLKPDRDVRPFQDVLLELGARLGLPGLATTDGKPAWPGGYADYIARHESRPGVGLLAGWRGEAGDRHGTGPANPRQLDRYAENGGVWREALTREQRYFKHANRDYLTWAAARGYIDRPEQIVLQVYSEPLQKFRLAARGAGPVQPPEAARGRIDAHCDPLPFWYPPFEEALTEAGDFPMHALTQRPMAMYQGRGAQNAWLRQIHGTNPLYVARRTAERLDIADGDRVRVESPHGALVATARLMEGVHPDTVWTWNGIGKRPGAWNLDPDAPEARTGFLLNPLLSVLLPPGADGGRGFNADPVTGQAAWYDLRVRIEKCAPDESPEPSRIDALRPPGDLPPRPNILRYGRLWSRGWRRGEDGA